jgi:hypothetical protein
MFIKYFSILIALVVIQLNLLYIKVNKTIDSRDKQYVCFVECDLIDSRFRSISNENTKDVFKNSNVSALLFLASKRTDFHLLGRENYSFWDDNLYTRFLNLWIRADFKYKNNVSPPINYNCYQRYDFPQYDLNKAQINGVDIKVTSVYLYKYNSSKDFVMYYSTYEKRLIIFEHEESLASKCLI